MPMETNREERLWRHESRTDKCCVGTREALAGGRGSRIVACAHRSLALVCMQLSLLVWPLKHLEHLECSLWRLLPGGCSPEEHLRSESGARRAVRGAGRALGPSSLFATAHQLCVVVPGSITMMN